MSNKCSNAISRTNNARELLTATGDEIKMMAEVCLNVQRSLL